MTKTIDLGRIDNRATLADQVVNNTVYKQAMTALECRIIADFAKTKFKEQDVRDELWRQQQTLIKLKAEIESVMKTGKIQESNVQNKRFF